MHTSRVTLLKSGACHAKSGGLEKYTLRLAQAFLDKGCDVTLLTSGEISALPSNFNAVSLPVTSKLSFRKVQQFDRLSSQALSKTNANLVFGLDRNRFQTHLRAGNGVHASYLRHRAALEGSLKRLSFALNPLHRLILNLEKKAFENPSLQCLFTNSHMVKDEILRDFRIDSEKICVVHNGVEWHEMQNDFINWNDGKQKLATELNIDPYTFHFVFVGHNFRRKGLDQLLAALALLPHENFHLSIIGYDKNLKYYAARVHALKLQHKVRFLGSRKDVRRFYQLADVLIIPSLYDPFANVTVEALAMGVFVISSKMNGGHEILTHESGIVLNSLSRDELAAALLKALKQPKMRLRAEEIRASVKHLDFSNQLNLITQRCLS